MCLNVKINNYSSHNVQIYIDNDTYIGIIICSCIKPNMSNPQIKSHEGTMKTVIVRNLDVFLDVILA